MANWEELPKDVLEHIAGRLATKAYLAFGGVCTSWRSAAAKEAYKAKSKAPWLMIYGGNQTPQFFSPSRIYPVQLPGSIVQTLSTPGWMLVLEGYIKYRLFNLFSGVRIKLPTLEKFCHKSRLNVVLDGQERPSWDSPRIDRIALSSIPSSSRSSTVMISVHRDHGLIGEFAFHRSGEDAWTVVSPAMHLPSSNVLQLIYYDGLFVALDANKQIMTLNIRERRMESQLVLGQRFEGHPYLVECAGSLLVAWKIWGKVDRTTKKFRVFEVDLKKGTQEEVKSLGNSSLLLNADASSSLSVEFNAESCLPGIKPNHVYFTDYNDKKKKSYNMDNGKVEPFHYANSRHHYAAQWFQPSF